jgi:hypothetical protein
MPLFMTAGRKLVRLCIFMQPIRWRLSTLPVDDAANFLPPLTAYSVMRLGKVALLPYFRPGDSAVANAIKGTCRKT